MATPQAIEAHLSRVRKLPMPCPVCTCFLQLQNPTNTSFVMQTQEMLKRFAPRCPMTELPDKYYVTKKNSDPPLIHFAIPVDTFHLFNYANEHNLIEYSDNLPCLISPVSAIVATEHLSQEVEYELEFGWPFEATADCGLLLGLYSNYTIDDKKLTKEDEEDVIQMVKEALGLDKSVRPKWYFDVHDDWRPGDSDDEAD